MYSKHNQPVYAANFRLALSSLGRQRFSSDLIQAKQTTPRNNNHFPTARREAAKNGSLADVGQYLDQTTPDFAG